MILAYFINQSQVKKSCCLNLASCYLKTAQVNILKSQLLNTLLLFALLHLKLCIEINVD
jgi:hypothetical protein